MIYVPEVFAEKDRETLLQLIRNSSFATLISSVGSDPIVAHVPVLLDETGSILHAHVARANPVWRDFMPDRELLFLFHGPHHYISPNWYNSHPSVPTWNYAVIHVSGIPDIIEDQKTIESMLRRLVAEHESSLETPWQMDLPEEYLRNMINGIVAFETRITRIEGKFKLSQNRSLEDRRNVIAALQKAGGDNATGLAALMQRVAGR
jgi:transcriptional regulator